MLATIVNRNPSYQTTAPYSRRPIRSSTACASTLVPSMSNGAFEFRPRLGEMHHLLTAAISPSNRPVAASRTIVNAHKRSLSARVKPPSLALLVNVRDDMQALRLRRRSSIRNRAASRCRYSDDSPWRTCSEIARSSQRQPNRGKDGLVIAFRKVFFPLHMRISFKPPCPC